MKKFAISPALVLLAGVLVIPAVGQNQAASPANRPAPVLEPGTPINARLDKPVDAKTAKHGDELTAKVLDDVWSADTKLVLPHGSKLVGYVSVVQARSKETPESRLGIVFDTAVLPNGDQLSFRAIVVGLDRPHWPGAPGYPIVGDDAHDRSAAGSRDPRVMRGSSGMPGAVNPMWTEADKKDPLNANGDRLAELKMAPYGNIQVVTSTKRDVKLDSGFTLQLEVTRSVH